VALYRKSRSFTIRSFGRRREAITAPLVRLAGYGGRLPLPCTFSAVILILQCLTQIVLEPVCVGLVFARLSHPKARGRSIFISESAVITRRDGALKLCGPHPPCGMHHSTHPQVNVASRKSKAAPSSWSLISQRLTCFSFGASLLVCGRAGCSASQTPEPRRSSRPR
jgi:hypothetical protein